MIITVTLTALFISLQHRCDVGITEHVSSFVQLCATVTWALCITTYIKMFITTYMGFVHYNIHQNVHLTVCSAAVN